MAKIILLVGALVLVHSFDSFHGNYLKKISRATDREEVVTEGYECPKYVCDSSLPLSQCVGWELSDSNTYSINPCDESMNLFCPIAMDTFSNSTCVSDVPLGKPKYPGDPCTTAQDCLSPVNTCTAGVCKGVFFGLACSSHADCNVNEICSHYPVSPAPHTKCGPMKQLANPCTNNPPGSICQNGLVCYNGSCSKVFQNEVFEIFAIDELYAPYMCKTGYYEEYSPGLGNCLPAPKSPHVPYPIKCNIGEFCLSDDGFHKMPCECGYNADGQGYCPLFPGDEYYQKYLELLNGYLSNPTINTNCHIFNVGQEACGYDEASFEQLRQLRAKIELFPQIQDNSDCIKKTYTADYWNLFS